VKTADHPHDRLHERTGIPDRELDALIAQVRRKKTLEPGQTYFYEWPSRGFAVIAPSHGHAGPHVVKTVLGPTMRPPGRRLELDKTAQVWDAFFAELARLSS